MKRVIFIFLAWSLLPAVYAQAGDKAGLTITRLDCGVVKANDLNLFSDTDDYIGQSMTLVDSCYLLRHGDDYLLWDTGLPAVLKGAQLSDTEPMSPTLSKTIIEQLKVLKVDINQIKTVAISHYHFDHIGQLPDFTHAKLLIGKGDWDAVTAENPAPNVSREPFRSWIEGDAANVEAVAGDKDIFDDGSVIMLAMPGHTPGHSSLLVKLENRGPLLLTGDLAHFTANYNNDGVPVFNTDRADTLASLHRFKRLAKNRQATVVIQHEPADVSKLPAFPASAD